jgi:hypothetical protein
MAILGKDKIIPSVCSVLPKVEPQPSAKLRWWMVHFFSEQCNYDCEFRLISAYRAVGNRGFSGQYHCEELPSNRE